MTIRERVYSILGNAVFVLVMLIVAQGQQSSHSADLIEEFDNTHVFWKQFEVAKKIVALRDTSVLSKLEPWLRSGDRHLRGNAAFVFGSLGDERGFQVITAILDDQGDRPPGQGISGVECGPFSPDMLSGKIPVCWSLRQQISADRYYAAHLLGDLKDRRAVPILVALLKDPDVNFIVPWSLGEIGDKSAVAPLIETLRDKSPDMRVLAIYALQTLKAKEALPQIEALSSDTETIHFDGAGPVAEAARTAAIELRRLP